MAMQAGNMLPDDFNKRLILFGAGGLGRRIARGLKHAGVTPLAFCDNNRKLWGEQVEDIPIMSPADAVQTFPQAVFMVCIWHPSQTDGLLSRMNELRTLGCHEVVTFIPLLRKYPELFLPNLFWDSPAFFQGQTAGIDAARALLDQPGKMEFDRQLNFRTSGDPCSLAAPVEGPQYFPSDVISLRAAEVFVDCGAYTGDTIQDFLAVSKGRYQRIIALEPDERNLRALLDSIGDARIRTLPYAAGAKREVLLMSSSGASSAVCAQGDIEVQCATLDELLDDEAPTFIKMDIEGSEIDALRGGAATIRRCSPKLAVSVYHRPDDLWKIPLLLKELLPNSKLTLRSHMLDGFDTVCYCIPKD